MKPQYTTIAIRRSDVPRWVPSVCGEVSLDTRWVAWLIGGRPRTIRLRPGPRVLRVRLSSERRRLEAARPIEVEERAPTGSNAASPPRGAGGFATRT
jgi:hypothetical protein